MFNLSGSEVVFIAILGLIVLGPEKLPSAMRRVGKVYREIRNISSNVQREVNKVMEEPMREVRKLVEEPIGEAKKFTKDAGDVFGGKMPHLQPTVFPRKDAGAPAVAGTSSQPETPTPPDVSNQPHTPNAPGEPRTAPPAGT
ncbi:MAG: twin-arginine translocase TatA/TatE family subunit [Ilumatobacteraceae bacterium]